MAQSVTLERTPAGQTTGSNQGIVSFLNKQIANWNVLFVKLHNYHWFVKGPEFFTLHAKFEELYTEAAQHIDDLAERVLSIGGTPQAAMREYIVTASVQESAGGEKPKDMVRAIETDFRTLIAELGQGMKDAQQAGDEATADMLLGIRASLEKHAWMLSSFNG